MARELATPVVAAAVALVVGLALGGMGPRAEVRALRARVEASRACDAAPVRATDVTRVLQGRPWATPPREEEPEPAVPHQAAPPDPDGAPAVLPDEAPVPPGAEGAPDETADEVGFDAAREAMDVRNRQAWRALEEQAAPSPEQREAIEAAVDEMNGALVEIAKSFADQVAEGQPPERRDLMVFAADTLETFIAAEDGIFEALTPEQRDRLDPEVIDPTAYVDASILDVLERVDGLR